MRFRIRPRLTYANVISSIALFVVLGGGAYATIDRKIRTADIQNRAVTTPKLAKQAVGTGKLKKRAVGTGKLKRRAVGTGKLKPGAVGTGKLKNNSVTPRKLAPGVHDGIANYAAAAFVPVEHSTHNNNTESVCGNFVPSDQGAENMGDLDARLGSFIAPADLPHGASLRRLTLFANDFSAEDAHLYLVRKQIGDGLSPQFDGYDVIASTSTSGAENNEMREFSTAIDGVPVNDRQFFYFLELVVCDAIEPFTTQITYWASP